MQTCAHSRTISRPQKAHAMRNMCFKSQFSKLWQHYYIFERLWIFIFISNQQDQHSATLPKLLPATTTCDFQHVIFTMKQWLVRKTSNETMIGFLVTRKKCNDITKRFVSLKLEIMICFLKHWYVSLKHWYVSLKHWYVSLKHWYVSLKHWYVSLKHWYVSLKHWYVSLKHWYVSLKYWYVSLKHWFVSLKQWFVSLKH